MAGVVTVYSYDLMSGTLIAELPINSLTFSRKLNAAGSLAGTINIADPRVRALGVYDATRPVRSLLIVDIDGTIQWGGIAQTRTSTKSAGTMQIGATEAWNYYNKRLQPKDYTTYPAAGKFWLSSSAEAAAVAAELVWDVTWTDNTGTVPFPNAAFAKVFPMNIVVTDTIANPNPVAVSYPLAQYQTVGKMVTDLAGAGYNTGFDFGIDWAWYNNLPGGTPVPTLNIVYPRRGRPASATSLVLDSTMLIDYTWSEDGSQMLNSILLNASQASVQVAAASTVSLAAGYPLMEGVTGAPQTASATLATTLAQGDLAQYEWPVVAPTAVLNMFGDIGPGSYIEGDDVRWIMAPDDRFPSGFDTYVRVIATDYTVADEGVSTMTMTFNNTISLSPTTPLPS